MGEVTLEVHRALLGILLFVNGGISVVNIWSHRRMTYSRGVSLHRFLGIFSDRFLAPGLLFAVAIGAWVVGFYPLISGLVTIGALLWLRKQEQREWPGDLVVSLGSYAPAAVCLVGVYVGEALWAMGLLPNSTDGWHIAAGMTGAAWTITGVNKLKESGFGWMGARNMALLVAERTSIGRPSARRVRRYLMNSPILLALLGGLGLLGELVGVLFCFPELRVAYAGVVCIFLFLNWILLGFFEHEWTLVMVAIAVAA